MRNSIRGNQAGAAVNTGLTGVMGSLAYLWDNVGDYYLTKISHSIPELQILSSSLPDTDYSKVLTYLLATTAFVCADVTIDLIHSAANLRKQYNSNPAGFIRDHYERELV